MFACCRWGRASASALPRACSCLGRNMETEEVCGAGKQQRETIQEGSPYQPPQHGCENGKRERRFMFNKKSKSEAGGAGKWIKEMVDGLREMQPLL